MMSWDDRRGVWRRFSCGQAIKKSVVVPSYVISSAPSTMMQHDYDEFIHTTIINHIIENAGGAGDVV